MVSGSRLSLSSQSVFAPLGCSAACFAALVVWLLGRSWLLHLVSGSQLSLSSQHGFVLLERSVACFAALAASTVLCRLLHSLSGSQSRLRLLSILLLATCNVLRGFSLVITNPGSPIFCAEVCVEDSWLAPMAFLVCAGVLCVVVWCRPPSSQS